MKNPFEKKIFITYDPQDTDRDGEKGTYDFYLEGQGDELADFRDDIRIARYVLDSEVIVKKEIKIIDKKRGKGK